MLYKKYCKVVDSHSYIDELTQHTKDICNRVQRYTYRNVTGTSKPQTTVAMFLLTEAVDDLDRSITELKTILDEASESIISVIFGYSLCITKEVICQNVLNALNYFSKVTDNAICYYQLQKQLEPYDVIDNDVIRVLVRITRSLDVMHNNLKNIN